MLNIIDAGESHGPALTAIITGLPYGLKVDIDKINRDLSERQKGYGRGARQTIEADEVIIQSGIRGGLTMGSPVTLQIKNRDFENWKSAMDPVQNNTDNNNLLVPRPGHADLAGATKFHQNDLRNIIERSSARKTAIKVAVGSLLKQFLAVFGMDVIGFLERVHNIEVNEKINFAFLKSNISASMFRTPYRQYEQAFKKSIDEAKKNGDTIGGVIRVIATGVLPGIGSFTDDDLRLDSAIAHAVISIGAIKGIEIGNAIENSSLSGSQVHDEIFPENGGIARRTNRAGGIEGGMSNGEPIDIRCFMKPIPTLMKSLNSINLKTGKPDKAIRERSDTSAVRAASIIAQSVVAIVLSRFFLMKFAGDTMSEVIDSHNRYLKYLNTSGRYIKQTMLDSKTDL
ncbi:MAG: chorismate synthase [Epsilonproteobacteria bacterium]|nr:chorismate synthase [Campylobacterota bacterium]